MRQAWLAGLLMLTAACGAYSFPGGGASPTPSPGTVSGRVLAVPCSPLVQPGPSCAGRPVPSLELDYLAPGGTVSRTVTDAKGGYSITLEPAGYAVKLKTYMRVISGPLKVEVQAGSSSVANYVLDSGIRVPIQPQPVPQA